MESFRPLSLYLISRAPLVVSISFVVRRAGVAVRLNTSSLSGAVVIQFRPRFNLYVNRLVGHAANTRIIIILPRARLKLLSLNSRPLSLSPVCK